MQTMGQAAAAAAAVAPLRPLDFTPGVKKKTKNPNSSHLIYRINNNKKNHLPLSAAFPQSCGTLPRLRLFKNQFLPPPAKQSEAKAQKKKKKALPYYSAYSTGLSFMLRRGRCAQRLPHQILKRLPIFWVNSGIMYI